MDREVEIRLIWRGEAVERLKEVFGYNPHRVEVEKTPISLRPSSVYIAAGSVANKVSHLEDSHLNLDLYRAGIVIEVNPSQAPVFSINQLVDIKRFASFYSKELKASYTRFEISVPHSHGSVGIAMDNAKMFWKSDAFKFLKALLDDAFTIGPSYITPLFINYINGGSTNLVFGQQIANRLFPGVVSNRAFLFQVGRFIYTEQTEVNARLDEIRRIFDENTKNAMFLAIDERSHTTLDLGSGGYQIIHCRDYQAVDEGIPEIASLLSSAWASSWMVESLSKPSNFIEMSRIGNVEIVVSKPLHTFRTDVYWYADLSKILEILDRNNEDIVLYVIGFASYIDEMTNFVKGVSDSLNRVAKNVLGKSINIDIIISTIPFATETWILLGIEAPRGTISKSYEIYNRPG